MIAAIIAYGFGSYAGVNFLPTLGFAIGTAPTGPGAGRLLLLGVGQ